MLLPVQLCEFPFLCPSTSEGPRTGSRPSTNNHEFSSSVLTCKQVPRHSMQKVKNFGRVRDKHNEFCIERSHIVVRYTSSQKKWNFSHFLLLLLSFLNFHAEIRYPGLLDLPSKCYQIFVSLLTLSFFSFSHSLSLYIYTHYTHRHLHCIHVYVCVLYTQIYISVYIQLVMCCTLALIKLSHI